MAAKAKEPRRKDRGSNGTFTIRQARWAGEKPWEVYGRGEDGKRVRRYFETRAAAEVFQDESTRTRRNHGVRATALSEAARREAAAAYAVLQPWGATLLDAAKHYAAYLKQCGQSITARALADEFIASREAKSRSSRHVADLRTRLGRWGKHFSDRLVSTITTRDLDDWLAGYRKGKQPHSALSINNFRRVVHSALEYAKRRGYVAENACSLVEKMKAVRATPLVFTPAEMEALFKAVLKEGESALDLIAFLAIGGFAGLRTAEIERLRWEDVRFHDGFVEVRAENSKTAQRRLVEMTPNLRAWLSLPGVAQKIGPVTRANRALRLRTIIKDAELAWKDNALRHSAASYHIAEHSDAAKTALMLGHISPRMTFESYRALVTPEAAHLWWGLVPEPAPRKVIHFTRGAA